MGKVNVLEVVLSNGTGVYTAGQLLQGHINLELNNSLQLRDIRIHVRGKAFVHWTEQLMRGPGESRFREIRHHSATEEYIDWSQSLLGRTADPSQRREMAAGQYTYPFQFQLPSNVPTSFEGQYGYLRYWVKVTIERPWNHDQSAKKVFTIICPVDLNREPSAPREAQSRKQKRLCCLCCRSGPVSAILALAQRGFVPGETIHINAEITNRSRRKMSGSSVELLMTVLYRTPTKSRAMTQQVLKVKRGPICAGGSDVWEEEKMVIPPLPPSYLNGCGIMGVKYTLELRVDPEGPAFELNVPVEIIVGTVPLNATVERYLAIHRIAPPSPQPPAHPITSGAAPSYAMVMSGAGQIRPQPQPTPQYYLMPRFAYYTFGQSRIHDEEDNGNTRCDSHFTPSYVYYTWQPQELQFRQQQGVRFAA